MMTGKLAGHFIIGLASFYLEELNKGIRLMASKSGRSHAAKGPSQRQLRVGETLRHALSEILIRRLFDPDLVNVSITISEISVSPDLANARASTQCRLVE